MAKEGKSGKKGKGNGKSEPAKREPEKCQLCGLIGHTQPGCRKFLASQNQTTSQPGSSTDGQLKKRKVAQDITALEQPFRSLSMSVNEFKSEPELCGLTIDTV